MIAIPPSGFLPFLRFARACSYSRCSCCNPALGLPAIPTGRNLIFWHQSGLLQSRPRASCHSYTWFEQATAWVALKLQSRPRASCHSYTVDDLLSTNVNGSCNPALGLPAIPTPLMMLAPLVGLELQSRPRASCHSYRRNERWLINAHALQSRPRASCHSYVRGVGSNSWLTSCCNPALGLPAIPTY